MEVESKRKNPLNVLNLAFAPGGYYLISPTATTLHQQLTVTAAAEPPCWAGEFQADLVFMKGQSAIQISVPDK